MPHISVRGPVRWRSGWSVHFAVGRPGAHFPNESYQKTLFTAFLPGAQQNRDSVKNKPASLLVSLGKTLNGIPPSLCGRKVMVSSSLPVVTAPI